MITHAAPQKHYTVLLSRPFKAELFLYKSTYLARTFFSLA